MIEAIWKAFAHSAGDAAPALIIGLVLSAGVQWLVERSQWAAKAVSWVAQSVSGAALAGAVLPGCSMTTVPLAMPLKRQGAGDGALLAFIITSALLGPASIILTFAMFGPVWGILRVVLPLIAVCLLGWTLNRFGKKLHPENEGAASSEASCPSACGCGGGDSGDSSEGGHSFWADLLRMARNLVPIFLLGLLAAAAASVLVGKEQIEQWMNGGALAYVAAVVVGIPAYVCEGGEVPLTAALVTMGVGVGPAFTFMQASVGTCLPTMMMLPKVIGTKLTAVYLAFWLVYSVASGMLLSWMLRLTSH
ncbi:MAG: permease [Terrimicrobiaceae bacterium]|nr:permease [Terrimicrobiaceae bacterium]